MNSGSIRVGCAVLVTSNGRVLLGRRGKEPFYGKWIIPGGGVNYLERLEDTARREMLEEVGLDVRIGKCIHVAEIIAAPGEHRVVVYVSAQPVTGKVTAGSDLLEARYFTKGEVRRLYDESALTPTVANVLIETGWLGEKSGSIEKYSSQTKRYAVHGR